MTLISLRRSFGASLFFTVLALLLLAACDLQSSPAALATLTPATGTQTTSATAMPTAAPPTRTPATPTPAVPQGGTLTIRASEPITTFTPWDLRSRAAENVADLLYNGLVRLDDTLKPQPDLAERWETSPNDDIITFTLRSNIRWSDGQTLTGADVAWTLSTLRTITATNSLLFDLRTVIAEVRAPLSSTVVLSLTRPYAPLLADLSLPILPRHKLESRSPQQLAALNFLEEPVGSGPFRLAERSERGLTFTRNERYFRGRPNLDGVALVVAPDPEVAAKALDDGTLLLAEMPPTDATTATLAASLRHGDYPENGFYFLAFNVRAERPFSDTRVRQALALAVDVPAMAKEAGGPQAIPLATSLSPATWAYPPGLAPPRPDLDRARALLDEAGWRLAPGQAVRTRGAITLTAQIFTRGDDARRIAAARRIATGAEQVGIKLEVVPSDFKSVILAKLAPPYSFDLLLSSWINAPNTAGFPTSRFYDPDDYAIFGADRIWKGPSDTRAGLRNIGGFSNGDYESAAKRAREIYDPDARAKAIAAAQAVLVREQPYLFLWTDSIRVVMSAKIGVDGGKINLDSPRYLWNVERWYIGR